MEEIKINNTLIKYYDNKNEGKEVLICLHGWGQSHNSFKDIFDHFGQDYHIISLDLPGFGQSEEPPFNTGVYDYAQMLENFINEKGYQNVTIMAHSFGGRISVIYAANNPENVNRMILTGAAGIVPKKSFSQKLGVLHYKFKKFLVRTPFFFQFKDDLFNNSGSQDYKNASAVMKSVIRNTVNEDLRYLFPKITAKTLLYWGSEDDQTPLGDGYVFNELIEDSRLEIAQNHGHFCFQTNKDDFLEKVKDFLKI